MWPKVLMQLFELLPHVSRLVPVADRYFAAKTANDAGNEAALAALAEGVQGDLGKVVKAHESLYRALQDQGNEIAALGNEVRTARAIAEQSDRRITALDQTVKSLGLWLKVAVGLNALLVVLVLVLLLRGH